MFDGCYSLTALDISSFDTSNVTDMSLMFTRMKSDVIVKVKDTDIQNWVLTSDNGRPSSWTTDNTVIV